MSAISEADLIARYKSLGFRLLYWERKGADPKNWKGPSTKGWNSPAAEYPLALFDSSRMNIGTFSGEEIAPGKFLADVDLDWAPGLALAARLLPLTGFGFGREGKKLSHAMYTTSARCSLTVYDDISEDATKDGDRLVELRGGESSHMTMIAPSLHSPNITVNLVMAGELLHVELNALEDAVLDYAIGCLLFKRVPGGLHHDGRIALAGLLLKRGFSPERVICIGEAVCEVQIEARVPNMSTKDVSDMTLVVNTTAQRIAKKDKKIAGGPKLAEFIGHLGEAVVHRLCSWIDKPRADALILSPSDPMPSAREFAAREHTTDGIVSLRHQSGVFYDYRKSLGAYHDHDEPAVRASLYKFLEQGMRWTEGAEPTLVPFQPTKSKVENVLDALRAVCNLPTIQMAPCWLDENSPPISPVDMLACPNGLLHIPTRTLYPTTPHFFTLNGIDFNYESAAPDPNQWISFLSTIWPEDQESIDAAQEMFGYMLTPDTRFQKIFLEIGPPRSGKGIKARILRRLVGERNVCSPTLAAFGRGFGKQVLVGKTLAVISDARISGHTDTASVAEALLSISGEDTQTVERKFLPDWTGKLATRFLMLTNELPRITDVSGALAKRFIVLTLKESFLGREDLGLFDRLVTELPGILNWALEGRDRLYARGYFNQPASSSEMIEEFNDLGSPEATFLKAATVRSAGHSVSQKDLFAAWREWCTANGREHSGTAQSFGRNIRSVNPWITVRQLGSRGEQERHWEGLRLLVAGEAEDAPF